MEKNLKQTKNSTQLTVYFKAYNSTTVERACNHFYKCLNTDFCENNEVNGRVYLPTKRRIYCVLRSPHVNKDSREHFEIRVHRRLIHIFSVSSYMLKHLKNLNFEAGVSVEIKLSKLSYLDFYKKRMHLTTSRGQKARKRRNNIKHSNFFKGI